MASMHPISLKSMFLIKPRPLPSVRNMNQSCFLLLLLPVLSLEAEAKVTAVIVFGDSSVDAGNNNYIPTVARSNFQPYGRDFIGGKPTGRFSNGRLATDFVSEAFGLPSTIPAYLDPSLRIQDLTAGVCFASAGSGFDNATSDILSVIPMWKELEHFKDYKRRLESYMGEGKAEETLREALYVVSAGTNDFLENYYVFRRRSSVFPIEKYQQFVTGNAEGFIRDLYSLGARKIDVTGLPPMGCLPLERVANVMYGHDCNEDYNRVAMEFNSKQEGMVKKLNRQLPGIKLVYADVYHPFMDAIQNPSLYGFEDVMTGCCGTGLFEMGPLCTNELACQDASKYVFWDAFHPTERMNSVLAEIVMRTTLYVFK